MGGGLALKNAYRDVTRDGEAQGLYTFFQCLQLFHLHDDVTFDVSNFLLEPFQSDVEQMRTCDNELQRRSNLLDFGVICDHGYDFDDLTAAAGTRVDL